MREAAQAQSLCFDIALPARLEGRKIKGQITYVFDRMVRRYPADGWKWRRVKSLWNEEVLDRNIGARELRQLEETAALLDAARKAHADFIAETERMAAVFAAQDEDFYRPEIEARRSVLGGVDRSRAGGGES